MENNPKLTPEYHELKQAPPITKKEAATIIHKPPKDVKKFNVCLSFDHFDLLIVRSILLSN